MNFARPYSLAQSADESDNVFNFVPPWWVKIATSKPKCIYYFGSFNSKSEAIDALPGYVEDLKSESAQGIAVEIKQEHPQQLTVSEP
ncbi:MAG: DUF1816 domain-containing protein [Cyanobacteria bacterium P01_A01_bin.40]